ncbi:MAG: XRE family transcriptional regulator [Candidatus Omnitrophica bacterium]|nr:XRE family transcriptional regulator [Candidatus Omnitrophota bacterium]
MKLHDKIRQIRKAKGLSLTNLEERLVSIFGDKALRYNSLYRIEKGLRDARVSSLSQLCIGLGVSLKELKEGTEEENFTLVDVIKKRDKVAQYIYSEKAYAHILTKEKQPFLAVRLILEPQGKTKLEQDPITLGKFEKWVYGLKGKITCVVGQVKYEIKKDETLCFESNLPHSFENNTSQKAACIIVQNPKHI